jgi:hypothetical protein
LSRLILHLFVVLLIMKFLPLASFLSTSSSRSSIRIHSAGEGVFNTLHLFNSNHHPSALLFLKSSPLRPFVLEIIFQPPPFISQFTLSAALAVAAASRSNAIESVAAQRLAAKAHSRFESGITTDDR